MPKLQLLIEAEMSDVGGIGEVKVNGPVNDRFLCYALLEVAKDVIRSLAEQKVEERRIVPGGVMPVAMPFRR